MVHVAERGARQAHPDMTSPRVKPKLKSKPQPTELQIINPTNGAIEASAEKINSKQAGHNPHLHRTIHLDIDSMATKPKMSRIPFRPSTSTLQMASAAAPNTAPTMSYSPVRALAVHTRRGLPPSNYILTGPNQVVPRVLLASSGRRTVDPNGSPMQRHREPTRTNPRAVRGRDALSNDGQLRIKEVEDREADKKYFKNLEEKEAEARATKHVKDDDEKSLETLKGKEPEDLETKKVEVDEDDKTYLESDAENPVEVSGSEVPNSVVRRSKRLFGTSLTLRMAPDAHEVIMGPSSFEYVFPSSFLLSAG